MRDLRGRQIEITEPRVDIASPYAGCRPRRWLARNSTLQPPSETSSDCAKRSETHQLWLGTALQQAWHKNRTSCGRRIKPGVWPARSTRRSSSPWVVPRRRPRLWLEPCRVLFGECITGNRLRCTATRLAPASAHAEPDVPGICSIVGALAACAAAGPQGATGCSGVAGLPWLGADYGSVRGGSRLSALLCPGVLRSLRSGGRPREALCSGPARCG